MDQPALTRFTGIGGVSQHQQSCTRSVNPASEFPASEFDENVCHRNKMNGIANLVGRDSQFKLGEAQRSSAETSKK